MSSSSPDCWDILGLPPDKRGVKAIKTAYKKLSLLCHPDKINDNCYLNSRSPLTAPLREVKQADRFIYLVNAFQAALTSTVNGTSGLSTDGKIKKVEVERNLHLLHFSDPWSNAIVIDSQMDYKDTYKAFGFMLVSLEGADFALICRCGTDLFITLDQREATRFECKNCTLKYKII